MNKSLHAHTGMAASAEALLSPVLDALEKGRRIKGGAFRKYKVVVTGHSLGAGTAALLSLLLARHFPLEHVTAYAFAPPPILAALEDTTSDEQPGGLSSMLGDRVRGKTGTEAGEVRGLHQRLRSPSVVLTEMAQAALNPSLRDLPRGSPPLPRNLTIHSFVHNEDLIPRCSMHEFMNMLAAADAIDKYTEWSAADRAAMLIRGTLSGEELQQLKDVLTAATSGKELKPSEDHQLVIPGHLYWLLPRSAPPIHGSNSGGISSGCEGVEAKEHGGPGPGSVLSAAAGSNFALVRMQSCQDIFSGALLTGDSMFQDHLAGSYKNALINIDTRLD